MTEAVEFDVPDAGAPQLEGSEGAAAGPEQEPFGQPATVIMPGWTQQEASLVVGGLVANVVLAMYAMRWKQAPAAELWPAIAGDPEREFPLMGAGLAPVLDFIAPKGSPQAVGVSLTAGLGEVIGAVARRTEVLAAAPPPAKARPAPGPAPGAAAGPSPRGEEGGFRFSSAELRVLQGDDGLTGLGL